MWKAVTAALGMFKHLFSWLNERTVNERLKGAKKAGADEAAIKGSQEVDQLILDAERTKGQISHTEDAILNDPRNRARQRSEES